MLSYKYTKTNTLIIATRLIKVQQTHASNIYVIKMMTSYDKKAGCCSWGLVTMFPGRVGHPTQKGDELDLRIWNVATTVDFENPKKSSRHIGIILFHCPFLWAEMLIKVHTQPVMVTHLTNKYMSLGKILAWVIFYTKTKYEHVNTSNQL